MSSYICLTHALADQTEAVLLSDTLIAYGFRCRRIHEATDPTTRARYLTGAAQVIALTSNNAHRAETVSADLRRLSDKGRVPICVSLEDNPIDDRFCHDTLDSDRIRYIERIPFPSGETPDAQAVGLFIHRLMIHRLVRIEGAFSPSRCRQDSYGRVIALAAAAHRGDREFAYALGCAYERGEGVPVLESIAATWIVRAAELGHPDAKLHLGELYLSGWGVEPDEAHAVALFTEVAETGNVRAEYRLGLCYLNGIGVVTDPVRAIHYLRRAARWGYPPALFRMGLLLRDGVGTAPDTGLAIRLIYDACRRGAAAEALYRSSASGLSNGRIFSSVSTEEDADDASVSGLHALSDLAKSDHSNAAGASAVAYPLPPSLYGTRAAKSAHLMTMRNWRSRLFRVSEKETLHASSRRISSEHPLFMRSAYTASRRPETAWIGSLTRAGHPTAPGGGQASGHPALYIDRDDLAVGVPFDLSEAAVALGGLLENGGTTGGRYELHPHPTRALVWYRYALRRGNTEALYRLANAYRRGKGALPDPAWAVVLYRMSAEWGDVRGQFSLAVACERGIGTDTDIPEAIRRYEQAAAIGYPPAQNNLGGCYEYGIGVPKNILTAVEWYVHAANAGLPEAMCRLGLCYECGRGVAMDRFHAFELYQKAAETGNAYALYRLGVCYDLGYYGGSEDADNGAHTSLSPCPPRYAEAIKCWKMAADRGVAEASYAMALCYAHGHGVRPDLEHALSYLRAADKGNCLQAVYRLAMCYLEGNGVVPNPNRAVATLERAIHLWRDGGSMYRANAAPLPYCAYTPTETAGDALYMLGYCILTGVGDKYAALRREERMLRALPLLQEAAALGHVGADIAMGDLYAYGQLPTPDGDGTDRAEALYRRAVRVSAARRGAVCPLPPKPDEEAREPEAPILSSVSLPDRRSTGLLASGADLLGILSIPALLTLARELLTGDLEVATDEAVSENPDPTPDPRARAWQYLADAAEQGSAEARVHMAKCAYYGIGTPKDPLTAMRLLKLAGEAPNGPVTAFLWLGDLYRTARCDGEHQLIEADNTYLRGLAVTPNGSEVGPYIVPERKEAHLSPERLARTEILFRLATFRAHYLSDMADGDEPTESAEGIDRRETFSYFAEAVLMGHPTAREDLARMYAEKRQYPHATAPARKAALPSRPSRRRRGRRMLPATRNHRMWLEDYYSELWLEPQPFIFSPRPQGLPSQIARRMQAPVTTEMLADALYYLGECFFEGYGITPSYSAAVACFREVVSMTLDTPRGTPAPWAWVWSQYSLGWCLLKGKGTLRNEREAVKWLTAASRSLGEACCLLGECHERGIGVDKADLREAIKYYRRALKLGCTRAERKVKEIEVILHARVLEAEKQHAEHSLD